MNDWRTMEDKDRVYYKNWVVDNLDQRWKLGEQKYDLPNGFQGDPLDHAIEEAFDLLLYLFYQKRRQNAERKD